jgi:hypothetical protein
VIDKIQRKIGRVKAINFLAGLTLIFASFLFFYDLFRNRYLLIERDLAPYFIPPRFFWVESLKQIDFPLWNPYQFSGHPFFANPQHAILYPVNILFFILPFDIAFNAIIVTHFFLSGLFTYLFLRELKASAISSLISALIFMLSGYLLSVHSLLTILLSVTWTPLIMLYFKRAIEKPGFKNEILSAIFITISFLGGGVEIVYGNFFILLWMVIFSPLNEAKGKQPSSSFTMRCRSLLISGCLFLSLSAIQLFPFFELFHYSIRGGGISYEEATIWSFAPKDILLFFLPDVYGYFLDIKKYWITQCWFKTLYTGGMPFILSLIFFLAPLSPSPERGEERGLGNHRKFFLSLMIFSIFLSLGDHNPLFPFVYNYVPFFKGIRYPVKFLYIFILVLSITAGLGFEALVQFLKERISKKEKHLFIILSLVCGVFLLFLVLGDRPIEDFLRGKGIDFPDFNHLSVNLYHAKRFLFYLTLFFLLLRVGQEVKWKGWTKILLVFFLIADLFGNMGFYGKEKASDYLRKTHIDELISSDKESFRIFSTAKTIAMDVPVLIANASPIDIFKEKHLPSMSLLYGLHDIWGIDVIRLKRVDEIYKALIGSPSISTTPLIDLYGVKYIVSMAPIEEGHQFELIYSRLEGLQGKKENLLKENTIKLYRNHNFLHRAWLVKAFRVMDSKLILPRMTSKEFDPRREVLLEETPPFLNPPHEGGAGEEGRVEFISESNNRLHLKVRIIKNTLLVLSDTYYPGWRALVNGKETKIYRANYNFRAILLEAGESEIKFIYDPMSFKIGALVSLITLIGVIVYFFKNHPKAATKSCPQRE